MLEREPRDWRSNVIPVVLIVATVAILQPVLEPDAGRTKTAATEEVWQRQRIGNLSLSVPAQIARLPSGALGQVEVSRSQVEDYEVYTADSGPVWLGLTRIRYSDRVDIDLVDVLNATIRQVDRVPGVSDHAIRSEPVRVSGRNAISVHGTVTRPAKRERMEGLVIENGRDVWQVMAVFEDQAEAERIADRILRSVRLLEVASAPH